MSGPRIFNPGQSAGALSVYRGQFAPFWTVDGGFAVWYFAGVDLAKGTIVAFLQAASYLNEHAYPVPISGNELYFPFGVVAEARSAYQPVPIVTGGRALVLPASTITAARGNVIYCSTVEAGRVAQSATVLGTAEHARQIGRWSSNGTGNGVLAPAAVHFS